MSTTRTTSTALAAALLVLACARGAPAPFYRGECLEHRFIAGRPLYQKTVTETSQKMTIGGNEIVQAQKQALLFRWAPVRQLPDGNWLVKQKLQAAQVEIEVGGNKISYDSSKPGGKHPLAAFFQAWIDTELTLTIGPRLKITRVEGRDALLARIAKADQALKTTMETLLSDNALKGMAEPLFAALPGKRVRKGERWSEKSTLELGGLGNYTTLSRYVFEGRDSANRELGRIAVTQQLKYTAAPPGAGLALPFKIIRCDFKKAEGTGTIWVNLSKGRTERSQTTKRLGGRMTIEVGGMKTELDLDQTQKTTTTISDVSSAGTRNGKR